MTIKQGTHAPFRFPVLFTTSEYVRVVQFTPSCRYDIDKNQKDINKLFGVGYFPTHRKNSVRFGWRYDLVSGMVEVLVNWCDNGDIYWNTFGFVAIGRKNTMVIRRHENMHEMFMGKEKMTIDMPSPQIGYMLHPSFGVNQTAPHDITINITQLK